MREAAIVDFFKNKLFPFYNNKTKYSYYYNQFTYDIDDVELDAFSKVDNQSSFLTFTLKSTSPEILFNSKRDLNKSHPISFDHFNKFISIVSNTCVDNLLFSQNLKDKEIVNSWSYFTERSDTPNSFGFYESEFQDICYRIRSYSRNNVLVLKSSVGFLDMYFDSFKDLFIPFIKIEVPISSRAHLPFYISLDINNPLIYVDSFDKLEKLDLSEVSSIIQIEIRNGFYNMIENIEGIDITRNDFLKLSNEHMKNYLHIADMIQI